MIFSRYLNPEKACFKRKFIVFQDAATDEWEIFATNRWTHFCLAYRKKDGFLKIIKVHSGIQHSFMCIGRDFK